MTPDLAAPGDPYAAALTECPYAVLPAVRPDDAPAAVVRVLQRLQRRGLTAAEDVALRCLYNLPARLAADLFTFGTTPGVAPASWEAAVGLLREGRRAEVAARVTDSPGGLHVRAVLAANELAWAAGRDGRADDGLLAAAVGRWAAVLGRPGWLRLFAVHRCRVWGLPPPAADGLNGFIARAADLALGLVRRGAAEPARRARWDEHWECERAAIEAVGRLFGPDRRPVGWPDGVGPLGLADLGRTAEVRERVAAAAGDAWPVSVAGLRAGRRAAGRHPPAAAAAAVRCFFSDLTPVAAAVWAGNGPVARSRLASVADGHRSTAEPWFGPGRAGRRAIARTVARLEADALQLQLHDQLSRAEDSAGDAVETAGRLILLDGELGETNAASTQVESLLAGRLRAAAEHGALGPDELDRLIAAADDILSLLRGRGLGGRCEQELALAAYRGAALRAGRMTESKVAERAVGLLFRACELAPGRLHYVQELVAAVLMVPGRGRDGADDPGRRAAACARRCRELTGPSAELDDLDLRILERLDPAAARAEALRRLDDETHRPGVSEG